MAAGIGRTDVLAFRVRAQQLDRVHGDLADTAVLDLGVQDTGPDGGLWALACRGVEVAALSGRELATVWTLRGAPHLYRREDLPAVAAAVEPFSDADAGKRILNAAKPLKDAGIPNLVALDAAAKAMRSVVTKPMVKGEVSTRMTALMEPPYLRFCGPCNATHMYELPFRLAALRAGLELQPGTSPPVLQPMRGFGRADEAPPRFDLVRGYLRLLGPATPREVAGFLDAPLKDVKDRWPEDAVDVTVVGERRSVLATDEQALRSGPVQTTRLLGPYDLFVQAKDRALLVDDPARAKALWPVLGRPGAVLHDGELVGSWRPRQSSGKLTVALDAWVRVTSQLRAALGDQAERLAAFRGVRLSGLELVD